MSLRFRVFGLPRAGTSWASVWLSQHPALCIHDPAQHGGWEWALRWAGRRPVAGLSCTALWLYDDPCPELPTLLLYRERAAATRSLQRVGLPPPPAWVYEAFECLNPAWPRLTIDELVGNARTAREMWEYLLGNVTPWDGVRYAQLCELRVIPAEPALERTRQAVRKLLGVA